MTKNRIACNLSLALGLILATGCCAEGAQRPLIGAQVSIRADMPPEKIESLIKMAADYGFGIVRMNAGYGGPGRSGSNAAVDAAFAAAERYGIKVALTVSARPGAPNAEENLANTIRHFKDKPNLDNYIVWNEPGRPPANTPAAIDHFRQWLKDKYKTVEALNTAWRTQYGAFDAIQYDPSWDEGGTNIFTTPIRFIDWYAFWRYYWTWQVGWVADQVQKIDPVHQTQANGHMLISNLAHWSFDLPAWAGRLTSLGVSVHPSWHFGLLKKDQAPLGVSYMADVVRGAAKGKPFYFTELQAGNNISSGYTPMCPTAQDLAQWLWVGVGAGADRISMWQLTVVEQGNESGEWSLLDFQGRPTERMAAVREVTRAIKDNASLFEKARPVESPIVILLSLETMTIQERFRNSDYPGRDSNAHVLAALAFYETLRSLGLPVQVKHIHDFDWNAKSGAPQLVILPDVTALSADQAKGIDTFVRNGNSALLTGLTGFYDPEDRVWALQKFPLEDLMGATLKEVRTIGDKFQITLSDPAITLPAHLWMGEIDNHSAEVIGRHHDWVTAIRKTVGKGVVTWIPSLVDVGAWLGDNKPLANLLLKVTEPHTRDVPVRFAELQPGCVMRLMTSGDSYVTVVANGAEEAKTCRLQSSNVAVERVLYGKPSVVAQGGRQVSLGAKETAVILWRKTQAR